MAAGMTLTNAAPAAGADPSPTGDPLGDPATRRRNFRLGVANGSVFQAGDSLIDASTVLPVLLSGLTRSNALIGLACGLSDMGWFLPQTFIAPWASRHARQMRLYSRTAIIRSLGLVLIAALAWPLRHHPPALLAAFFVGYTVYSVGAGFGGVAFMEIVGRTVPPGRLGSYFSQRMFWGGLGAVVAGLVVREVLKIDETGIKFVILFGFAGVISGAAFSLFSAIREPATPATPTADTPLALLKEGLGWLRHDAVFRRLFLARASQSLWLAGSPFMVLFAVRELGGGGRAAGTFLLARTAGFVLSNLLWHALSRHRGNREIMRVATAAECLLLVSAAIVATLSPWALGLVSARAAVLMLEGIAFFGGAAYSGVAVGYSALVIEMAPAGNRQSFVSLMSTFLGPTLLLPALGGAIADATSAPVLFALCGVAGLVGYRAAARLPASRPAGPAAESAAAPIEHGGDR
jgi:MFS family permease